MWFVKRDILTVVTMKITVLRYDTVRYNLSATQRNRLPLTYCTLTTDEGGFSGASVIFYQTT